jgi:hypothetical protein
MLSIEQRIRIIIGDLVLQLQMSHAQIEELQAQLQKPPDVDVPAAVPKGNGHDTREEALP